MVVVVVVVVGGEGGWKPPQIRSQPAAPDRPASARPASPATARFPGSLPVFGLLVLDGA